jgi:hypothetical protein
MIEAIESKLYKISKNDNYVECVLNIEVKDTNSNIQVFKVEVNELIELLQQSLELIN